ncbi:hypothetical protein B0T14DRAFT_499289 [Immersiella caudata]|uniref:Uncharacterized protein n=1 Tax=Immersiella caudata TaxID=314043 RepID=A0AA39WEF2_9PEZI|nr:hypothetical protein B0T14DRAFT_499289 [Immersiella caudata]
MAFHQHPRFRQANRYLHLPPIRPEQRLSIIAFLYEDHHHYSLSPIVAYRSHQQPHHLRVGSNRRASAATTSPPPPVDRDHHSGSRILHRVAPLQLLASYLHRISSLTFTLTALTIASPLTVAQPSKMCTTTTITFACEACSTASSIRSELSPCWPNPDRSRPDGYHCRPSASRNNMPRTRIELQPQSRCYGCTYQQLDVMARVAEVEQKWNKAVKEMEEVKAKQNGVKETRDKTPAQIKDAEEVLKKIESAEQKEQKLDKVKGKEVAQPEEEEKKEDTKDEGFKKRAREVSSGSDGSDRPDAKKGKQE